MPDITPRSVGTAVDAHVLRLAQNWFEHPDPTDERALWRALGFTHAEIGGLLGWRIAPGQDRTVTVGQVCQTEMRLTDESTVTGARTIRDEHVLRSVQRAYELLTIQPEASMPIRRMTVEEVAALSETLPADELTASTHLGGDEFEQGDSSETLRHEAERAATPLTLRQAEWALENTVGDAPAPARPSRRRRRPSLTESVESEHGTGRPRRQSRALATTREEPVTVREAALTRAAPRSRRVPLVRQTTSEHRPNPPRYAQQIANYVHCWLHKHEEGSERTRAIALLRRADPEMVRRAIHIADARVTEATLPTPRDRWQNTSAFLSSLLDVMTTEEGRL